METDVKEQSFISVDEQYLKELERISRDAQYNCGFLRGYKEAMQDLAELIAELK